MPQVHILATCRKVELLPATLLVFKTLRTGFPSSATTVTLNLPVDDNREDVRNQIIEACGNADVQEVLDPTRDALTELIATGVGSEIMGRVCRVQIEDHHKWVLELIEKEAEPFIILDTDICLWENFEKFDFSGSALAGRYVPQFFCKFANARTQSRLHTCCLYLDPVKIKERIMEYGKQFPDVYCCPRPTLKDLVFPRYVPQRVGSMNKPKFFDTCAGLWNSIGGQPFTDEQNLAFDHMQSGTLSDLVGPTYPRGNMREFHAALLDQPHLLKGQWKRDQEFYRSSYCD